MADWQQDLKVSSRQFVELVWPLLGPRIDGGDLVALETNMTNSLAVMFDRDAGIDFVQRTPSGLRGISSRVQAGASYDSWTIRKSRSSGQETEFAKRLRAIDDHYVYPHLIVQAYVQQGQCVAYAAAWTIDLIKHIRDGDEDLDWHVNQTDNADFYVVEWDKFSAKGHNVIRSDRGV